MSEQVNSRHSSETVDEESDYYTQHVAPLLDLMTGYVYGESSRSMRCRH